MKKVGLITYYGDNYGGILQAYALQQMAKVNGLDCYLVSNEFLGQKSGLKKMNGRLANLASAICNSLRYLAKRKTYHQYAVQNTSEAKKFEAFRRENLRVYKTGCTSYSEYLKTPSQYDVYLCGSDQICNPVR